MEKAVFSKQSQGTLYYTKQPGENLDAVKTVLCAPTGKAAYNIGGQTVHSLFCIPANQKLNFKPIDAQQLDTMRVKFQNLKIIFIFSYLPEIFLSMM